jgi:parallel beta-helix repeat protein
VCDGTSSACPADGFKSNLTQCRAAAGACDVAELCTGTSPGCPADALLPSGTTCRQSAGVCDVPEVCTGTSTQCPADGFQPAGTVCRAASGVCDAVETCVGNSATCPPNGFQPGDTLCDRDGSLCRPGQCDTSGTCVKKQNPCVVTTSSPERTFSSLQAAVDKAADGATIHVSGQCVEDVLVSDHSNLIIEGDAPTNGCPADPQPGLLRSTLKGVRLRHVLKVVSSPGTVVRNLNIIDGGVTEGLEIKYTSNATATCNCIAFNEDGIELHYGQSNVVTRNLVERNVGEGIRLQSTTKLNTVTDNVFRDNGRNGIQIESDSTLNTVSHNDVLNNDASGIDVDGVRQNQITRNLVTGNGTSAETDGGIKVEDGASKNNIDGNAISGNADELIDKVRCVSGTENTGSNVTGTACH